MPQFPPSPPGPPSTDYVKPTNVPGYPDYSSAPSYTGTKLIDWTLEALKQQGQRLMTQGPAKSAENDALGIGGMLEYPSASNASTLPIINGISSKAMEALHEAGAAPTYTTLRTGSYFLDASGNWHWGPEGQHHIKMLRDAGLLHDMGEENVANAFGSNQLIRASIYGPGSKGAGEVGLEIHHAPTPQQMEGIQAAVNENPSRPWSFKTTENGKTVANKANVKGDAAMDAVWGVVPKLGDVTPLASHATPASRFGQPQKPDVQPTAPEPFDPTLRKLTKQLRTNPSDADLQSIVDKMHEYTATRGLDAITHNDTNILADAWKDAYDVQSVKAMQERMKQMSQQATAAPPRPTLVKTPDQKATDIVNSLKNAPPEQLNNAIMDATDKAKDFIINQGTQHPATQKVMAALDAASKKNHEAMVQALTQKYHEQAAKEAEKARSMFSIVPGGKKD